MRTIVQDQAVHKRASAIITQKGIFEMKATYMGGKQEARVGDVVMVHTLRGIVISLDGTMVSVLGIGTSKETGDTFVLPQRHIEKLPASGCHFIEKQILNLV
jgi:hypothetical protein